MIHAYHFIFTAYGFWLPNDPRGSWSTTIRQYELLAFGPASKVETIRSVAHVPHDTQRRTAAKQALRYPPVRFTGEQARAIAQGFIVAQRQSQYNIYALAVLPDHAHVVIGRCPKHVDQIAGHLKAKATRQLTQQGIHPLAVHASKTNGRVPSPWARNHWCVFIDDPAVVPKVIRYVEDNPMKAGLPSQKWSAVAPYVDRR